MWGKRFRLPFSFFGDNPGKEVLGFRDEICVMMPFKVLEASLDESADQ